MKKTVLHHEGTWRRLLYYRVMPHQLLSPFTCNHIQTVWSKTVRIMRWSIIIIGIICCSAVTLYAGDVNGQSLLETKVTVAFSNESLKNALDKITEASGVGFMYSNRVASAKERVSIQATDRPLNDVLDKLFSTIPYTYKLVGKEIVVSPAPGKKTNSTTASIPPPALQEAEITVRGTVSDTTGLPLPGVTVLVKGSNLGTVTDEKGEFTLNGIDESATLQFRMIGFHTQEVDIGNREIINVVMKERLSELDEAVVIGYGTTTRRLNTGSVSKITSDEISRQPVLNPLATLQGRVPGLLVTQSNGVPGSNFRVQVRGQHALGIGQQALTVNSDPLFIIDGVPFAPNNNSINTLSSILEGGLSPFSTINPADIESIEVLKDADATAIYGSRGGNGVIIITTKKGKVGKTRLNINTYSGVSTATNTPEMMSTKQFLEMRTEAFANDGMIPNSSNAPDLMVFDSNRNTDFTQLLIGNTARINDIQASLSGGNANTQFLVSGNYRHETTIFPGDMYTGRGGVHLNLNHSSTDQRFSMSFISGYTSGKNNLITARLQNAIRYAPNLPELHDESGNLVWDYRGVVFENPLASIQQSYTALTDNLVSNLNLNYQLFPSLTLKASLGYNALSVDEVGTQPSTSQNPVNNPQGSSNFGKNAFKSWIIEPQLQYFKQVNKGELDVLIGGTWQHETNKSQNISAFGYSNDGLLGDLSAATSFTPFTNQYLYRYQAFFGRANYNWENRYILNLTGRRDGSSRFGPGKRFANFGAIGAAWLFSNENFMQQASSFLSFGKIRTSYGVTGTDRIGNYQYLDSWSSTLNPYENVQGLYPERLANPNYTWERNKKLEVAVELGFWENRALLSVAYFRNRSDNHLISYNLPSQTGFTSITQNFPALIENKGFEFSLNTDNIRNQHFLWSSTFNLTVPKNTLIDFPNIELTSYANVYEVGQSLSVRKGYEFLGVSPETGVFNFADIDGDGMLTINDRVVFGHLDPKFYGGINNSFSYKRISLDVFFEFRKQTGNSLLNSVYSNGIPGSSMYVNLPLDMLDRWQNPGDETNIQRFTANPSSPASIAVNNFRTINSGLYSDTSFIRLRNLNLSYDLSDLWRNSNKIENFRVYFQGQNLLTITNYEGGDPETQNIYTVPPLRTFTLGLQISL